MNDNGQLITRLKEEMQKNNVNALELAEKAGVGATFVYDILKGKSKNPTSKKLLSIAEALNVSLSYITCETSDKASGNVGLGNSNDVTGVKFICLDKVDGKIVIAPDNSEPPFLVYNSWVKERVNASPKNLAMIRVNENNISPILNEGDIAMIKTPVDSLEEGFYAYYKNGGKNIKFGRIIPSEGNKLAFYKGNEIYDVDENNKNTGKCQNTTILGKLIWFSREVI